jgi:hypothetical protein
MLHHLNLCLNFDQIPSITFLRHFRPLVYEVGAYKPKTKNTLQVQLQVGHQPPTSQTTAHFFVNADSQMQCGAWSESMT